MKEKRVFLSLLLCFLGSVFVCKADANTVDIYKAVKQGDVALVAAHIAAYPIDKILAYASKTNQKEVCLLLLQIKGQATIHQHFFEGLKYKKEQNIPLTATEALFLKWSLLRAGDLAVNVSKIDKINRGYTGFHALVQKVRDIEYEMQEQGYTTFVHGRNWEWNFVNDVWSLICAKKNNALMVLDTLALRYRDEDTDVQSLYDFRKDLLHNGVCGVISGTYSQGKEAEVIFMNRTPLSNIETWGECSGRYFIQNHSVRGSTRGLDFALQMLEKHGLKSFEKKVEELYKLHETLTDHGELICISIRNEDVDKLVYVARPNGYKYTSIWIKDSTLECIQKMEQKVHDDEDKFFDDGEDNENLIYCFAVPNIPGEQEVYTMCSVHLADSEKYGEYKKKLQELYKYMQEHTEESEIEEVKEMDNNGGYNVHKLPKAGLFGFLGIPWLGL